MKLEFLISELNRIAESSESIDLLHIEADQLLIQYINNDKVTKAFDEIPKGY